MTQEGLVANHIPFEADPDPAPFGKLRGHIARANPLWRDFTPEVEALVIFQGPDTYISPSWYPTKNVSGEVVPTWNYAVVHAHGPLRIIDDATWLREFVTKLTNRYEAGRSDPWQVTDAPPDFIEKQLGAIVGIEIPITRMFGKWKVSQNRLPQDRDGAIEGLSQEGGDSAAAMADLVRKYKDK
jgi:transcriptional regulator